jgi:hypothetical protein
MRDGVSGRHRPEISLRSIRRYVPTALGQDVQITVKPTRKARREMAVVARWVVGWAERREAHLLQENDEFLWRRRYAPLPTLRLLDQRPTKDQLSQ